MFKRKDGRKPDELRSVRIESNYLKDAEGSCLIEIGKTRVICSASIEERVPHFLRNTQSGWLTATYRMLPRSSKQRIPRDKVSGRNYEVERLIGRAFRSISNLDSLRGLTITIDCDVLQADGGTRTASITGGYVALWWAIQYGLERGLIENSPIREAVAAVSVGILNKKPILDLAYNEDSNAEVDMNIVLSESLAIVEIQGTGEKRPFTYDELIQLLELGSNGIRQLLDIQKKSLLLGV